MHIYNEIHNGVCYYFLRIRVSFVFINSLGLGLFMNLFKYLSFPDCSCT